MRTRCGWSVKCDGYAVLVFSLSCVQLSESRYSVCFSTTRLHSTIPSLSLSLWFSSTKRQHHQMSLSPLPLPPCDIHLNGPGACPYSPTSTSQLLSMHPHANIKQTTNNNATQRNALAQAPCPIHHQQTSYQQWTERVGGRPPQSSPCGEAAVMSGFSVLCPRIGIGFSFLR